MSKHISSDLLSNMTKVMQSKKLFIGGTPKSGTTWVQLILNAHPNIVCHGEGQLANMLSPKLAKILAEYSVFIKGHNSLIFGDSSKFPVISSDEDRYACLNLLASFLFSKYQFDQHTTLFAERSPDNVYHLPKLIAAFPEADFLIVLRDARDVTCSAIHHANRVNGVDKNCPKEQMKIARTMASLWLKAIDCTEGFFAKYPDKTSVVRYEGLLENPIDNIKNILSFLDLAHAEEIVLTCKAAASFEKMSGGRQSGQENKNSHFRKGIAGDWKHLLHPEVIDYLQGKLRERMERQNYIW